MPSSESNAVVIDASDANAAVQQLSQELRNFVVRTRTVPRTYEEFISKSQIKAPPPPAGQKYIIRRQAVVLVKR